MKKGNKIFSSFFILLICFAAAFYIGWVQFKIPNGKRGVVVSKTSGIREDVLKNGKFAWMWEKLLPTNTSIKIFDEKPVSFTFKVEDSLPEGSLYSIIFEDTEKLKKELKELESSNGTNGNLNFDALKEIKANSENLFKYSIEYSFDIKVSDEYLVNQVKKIDLQDQKELKVNLEKSGQEISSRISSYLLNEKRKNSKFVSLDFNLDQVLKTINFAGDFEGLEILNFSLNKCELPDFEIYNWAKKAYGSYMNDLEKELKKVAEVQAEVIFADQRQIKKMEQLGEILKKYPELNDTFKSGAMSDLLKILEK